MLSNKALLGITAVALPVAALMGRFLMAEKCLLCGKSIDSAVRIVRPEGTMHQQCYMQFRMSQREQQLRIGQ